MNPKDRTFDPGFEGIRRHALTRLAYVLQTTGRLSSPRNAQPPIRTGSFSTRRRFLKCLNIVGSATSATIAREAQAPAQK
jgi:hypothetical protein